MLDRKRLLSALLAGVMTVSSLAVSPDVFAADDEDEDKPIMTFDGQYDMELVVEPELLETDNVYDVHEEIMDIIERATGVSDYYEITYADLAKVRSLNLDGLDLVDVPSCINYMVNLTRLDLSSNLLQSEALKKLSLVGCTKLSSIDLSDNYLTNMPSWFVNDRVVSGNITQNFVDSQNPRFIETSIPTYYLMNGEELNEDNLKNQILKSIRMNNGKPLPEFFFEYNSSNPPYPVAGSEEYPYDLNLYGWEEFTVSDPANPDGVKKVNAPENRTIEVTVRLFNDAENDNTNTTVTIYLLSGKDLPSLKKRLQGLMTECEALEEKKYTTSSWSNFTLALDSAEAILQYEKADVQMLTNALNALTKARDNLFYGTEDLKKMLDGLITVGNTYKAENYSPSSWAGFSNALEKLKKISADTDARLETAQAAVKEFQRAQAALTSAELVVPDVIPKSEFEKIYGEAQYITASGVTRGGTPYSWSFYGQDLKEAADFNPEVKDSDGNESGILVEAGSNSGYRMFVTAADKELPGKATLEIDVSDKFTSGAFYLYKWNSSAKRSLMAGAVAVTNGTAKVSLTEGGVYYLCRNVQNFELKSWKYEVDNDKKTITIPPTTGLKVSDFKNSFDFGSYTTVLDADENPVYSNSNVKPGMTINAPNMDKYKVSIQGDVNESGGVDFEDITVLIDAFLKVMNAQEGSSEGGGDNAGGSQGGGNNVGSQGGGNNTGSSDYSACDIDGDGSVTFDDVSQGISYFLMVF